MILWLKLAHILAALWFAGGQVAFILLHVRLRYTHSLAEQTFCLRFAAHLTKMAIIPGGITAALVGVWLATAMGYHLLDTFWVVLSECIYLYATIVGVFYLTPSDRQALRASEDELSKGLPANLSRQLLARPQIVVVRLINLLAVLALFIVMIVRP